MLWPLMRFILFFFIMSHFWEHFIQASCKVWCCSWLSFLWSFKRFNLFFVFKTSIFITFLKQSTTTRIQQLWLFPVQISLQFIEKFRFKDADGLRYYLPLLSMKTFLDLCSPDLCDWLCFSEAPLSIYGTLFRDGSR